MRNSSACALSSDSVYLFGGKICSENRQLVLSDMILQYIVGSNVWLEMPIRLPNPMSLITPVKINSHQIALFGGLQYVIIPSDTTPTSTSDQKMSVLPSRNVLVLDVRLPQISFARNQLPVPFVSICCPFYNDKDKQLFLINEQQSNELA